MKIRKRMESHNYRKPMFNFDYFDTKFKGLL